MSETLSSGLTLTIPTLGEQNWDQLIRNQCFLPISEHDHTGSGNGTQLSTNALQADAVTGAKMRLANNEALRARNAANSSDRQILKLDSSDYIFLGHDTSDGSDSLRTYVSGGGAVGNTRGAYLSLAGNEHANTGQAELRCGNVSGAFIDLRTDGTQDIVFTTNGTNRWEVDGSGSTGALIPRSNNAYDVGSTSFLVANLYASTLRTVSTDLSLLTFGAAPIRVYTNNTERLNLESGGTFNFMSQSTAGTAGAISTYWQIKVNGTSYKLACYAL